MPNPPTNLGSKAFKAIYSETSIVPFISYTGVNFYLQQQEAKPLSH